MAISKNIEKAYKILNQLNSTVSTPRLKRNKAFERSYPTIAKYVGQIIKVNYEKKTIYTESGDIWAFNGYETYYLITDKVNPEIGDVIRV